MQPRRNDPCPCGSGKKYKYCCGKPESVPIIYEANLQPASSSTDLSLVLPATWRSCGTCTACCDGWLSGNIRGYEMKPGLPCHFRGQGSCTIYAERPADPCRNFICGWLMSGSPFPESFRPDRLGVLILPQEWRGRRAYGLIAAGREPDEPLIAAMHEIAARTGAVVYWGQGDRQAGIGPPEFLAELGGKASIVKTAASPDAITLLLEETDQ